MNPSFQKFLRLAGSALLAVASSATGADVLREGDFAIAINVNAAPQSDYPRIPDPIPGESVENVLDGDSSTKYLNFGKELSGFIVTPAATGLVIKSLTITTANDFPDRDPGSFLLFGTNDPITSEDGGRGDAENWVLIGEDILEPPVERFTEAPPVNIDNNATYTSYRLVFDTLLNTAGANSMQVADVQFYTADDAGGTPILDIDDPILSVDLDKGLGETPALVLDGDPATKYLNFGAANSGFIVTPASGSSVVQSLSFSTANDAPERDPTSFILYGTNDAIASTDNSYGDGEDWTEVARSDLELPADRLAESTPVDITNSTPYLSYRLIFDTLFDEAVANSMQVGDVQFFTGSEGSGDAILAPGDPILAVDVDVASASGFPENEGPLLAVDQFDDTKYLNFAGAGSGLIITPSAGASTISSFTITTANDAPGRDPATYILEGTNDPITSGQNSFGAQENWVAIQSGALGLPAERFAVGDPVLLPDNQTAYTSYRIIFDTIEDPALPLVQIADIQFDGIFADPPADAPQFAMITRDPASGQVSLVWDSVAGSTYQVEFSTDLTDWNVENPSVASQGASTEYVPTDARLEGLGDVFFRFSEATAN